MCDLQVLKRFDRVLLDPLDRQENKVAIADRYFAWKGEGPLQIPLNVLQGNQLHAELVNERGETIATADRTGPNDMLISIESFFEWIFGL